MEKEKMCLKWAGVSIELCTGSVTREQKKQIDNHCPGPEKAVQFDSWYNNEEMLKAVFAAENWWSVDDLDHVMGLLFADRIELDSALATMRFEIAGRPSTVDPNAFQLSFYAPETLAPTGKGSRIVRHGARRETRLQLAVNYVPPFDPSLLTLSFIDYPGTGLILIDLDYDGHDDVEMTFGRETYLQPRFI